MVLQRPSGFIKPCLPSKGARPPSGPLWVHEIKHDGYRLMVRRAAQWSAASRATATIGRGPHYAAQSEVAQLMRPRQKAARRRLLNSNLMIVDPTAINAGFDFRR
jgi:ATP-dependent DNA ligase